MTFFEITNFSAGFKGAKSEKIYGLKCKEVKNSLQYLNAKAKRDFRWISDLQYIQLFTYDGTVTIFDAEN